ncbi:golgin candidate 4-like [Iris pallida]|uniref:Golgin candidate 4-like n=1 Tax=Iris pallida TaxID=29817 RepID=A0AAX6GDC2_IRIPA|nr:golgin candidate 4-like [Iris pallida]KAJ6826367.1 golgin candidate 4-like [Iris pallida]
MPVGSLSINPHRSLKNIWASQPQNFLVIFLVASPNPSSLILLTLLKSNPIPVEELDIEKSGLLSKAAELDVTLFSVERLGLLSKAKELMILRSSTRTPLQGQGARRDPLLRRAPRTVRRLLRHMSCS